MVLHHTKAEQVSHFFNTFSEQKPWWGSARCYWLIESRWCLLQRHQIRWMGCDHYTLSVFHDNKVSKERNLGEAAQFPNCLWIQKAAEWFCLLGKRERPALTMSLNVRICFCVDISLSFMRYIFIFCGVWLTLFTYIITSLLSKQEMPS